MGMMWRQIIRPTILTGLGLIILTQGCQSPPDFPDVPKIKFLNLEETDEDQITLKIEFEDGNADLGLGPNQTGEPFHEYNYINQFGDTVRPSQLIGFPVDSVKNLFFSNTILSTYVQRNGIFIKAFYGIDFQTGDTIERPDIRFPPVTTKVIGQPVSGEIEIDISTRFFPWKSTDTLRFELYIFDRSLQRSNSITTSPFNI